MDAPKPRMPISPLGKETLEPDQPQSPLPHATFRLDSEISTHSAILLAGGGRSMLRPYRVYSSIV